MTTSLMTVEQFKPLVADLPLAVVGQSAASLSLVPLADVAEGDRAHLLHALEIRAGQKGLRVKRGVAVWSVRGFRRG